MGINEGPDDDGDHSSSGYWFGVGGNVAPSCFGLIIVLMVIVVCRRCRLGCRRIPLHPPPPDRFIPLFLDRIARLLGVVDNKS